MKAFRRKARARGEPLFRTGSVCVCVCACGCKPSQPGPRRGSTTSVEWKFGTNAAVAVAAAAAADGGPTSSSVPGGRKERE